LTVDPAAIQAELVGIQATIDAFAAPGGPPIQPRVGGKVKKINGGYIALYKKPTTHGFKKNTRRIKLGKTSKSSRYSRSSRSSRSSR
jgi:hypothetical protein